MLYYNITERTPMIRLGWLAGALAAMILTSSSVKAEEKPTVVTTFSILGDLTQRVGGDHIRVLTLVGPDGDAHVFEPGPKETAELAEASMLVVNGLGFEPWLARLEDASAFKGTTVVATAGITPLTFTAEAGATDPHA